MSLQNTSKIVDRRSLFLNPSTSNIEQGLTNDDLRFHINLLPLFILTEIRLHG